MTIWERPPDSTALRAKSRATWMMAGPGTPVISLAQAGVPGTVASWYSAGYWPGIEGRSTAYWARSRS